MNTKFASVLGLVMSATIYTIHVLSAFDKSTQIVDTQPVTNWSTILLLQRSYSSAIDSSLGTNKKVHTKETIISDGLLCPINSTHLVGQFKPVLWSPSSTKLDTLFPWVLPGGRYKPKECRARHHVAIIIPYRNRDRHLRTFLYNMHPFLKRQQLDYGIFIIEQVGTTKFNRAMLMNIGYTEVSKIQNYTCFIFHDIDLIPEDDRNYYTCSAQPRHLSAAIDKFKYRLPYKAIFGGASAMSREQFTKVNGFSNKFFGWGGEDDDMWNRLKHANYNVTRYAINITRYKMLKHDKEKTNKKNGKRYKLLKFGYKRYEKDGLNSLKYTLKSIKLKPLFTKISVDINEKEVMAS